MSGSESITSALKETRVFHPSQEFKAHALFSEAEYRRLKALGDHDPERYWSEAADELQWFQRWTRVLEWDAPFSKWFVGGKLNASTNCLDRHLATQPQKAALIWEGEPGDTVTWTYRELHSRVVKMTAALRKLGLEKGDRVAIYMPLIPESVVAMLACARGGFTHTVVFGGFSAEALKDRIQDCEAVAVITADFGYRKGARIALKPAVDQIAGQCPSLKHVITFARQGSDPSASAQSAPNASGSILQWDARSLESEVTATDAKKFGAAEELDSEHPLFILYTSGTTGKPKGLVHSTGGYLTGVLRTSKMVFDLKPTDLYWCTADIGWVTGHSYVVYGPLAAGATIFLYEGAPTHPESDRFWKMIERHRITILYTAPTAIRAFMRLGDELPRARDLTSLRLLGSVGEPINPEAWIWYHEKIGGGRCPVVDTFWQTETGAIVISPVPGVTSTKPGSATFALPGYDVEVLGRDGKPVPLGSGGSLVIRKPFPSMTRTIHRDPERFKKQYFSDFEGGIYFTGDGARKDEDGYLWALGRVDDVLNVSGHRLGTMEIESALVSHPKVAEAAVVGRPDELKGQAVVAFVTLKAEWSAKLKTGNTGEKSTFVTELKSHVAKEIGAIARPDDIRFADGLPKTRSGKIMRRLLRELATGGQVKGDTSTLEDLNALAALRPSEE